MDTTFAASPLFVATLLRVIAVGVLATEILLLWTARRGAAAQDEQDSRRAAPLGRLMWVATPALVLMVLSLWSAASVVPSRPAPLAPVAMVDATP
ncbi:MAG: hypothetical protein JST92_18480 [Deltaproteobacteria bacterium]|nr:hypothetical protein [Deltaproteobacteria bacterium]